MKKQSTPVLIQLDCDGYKALNNHYGMNKKFKKDNIFFSLEKFLNIFKKYNIRATLFLVGKDLEDPVKKNLISMIINDGHEIANHTFNHPSCLSDLNYKEKEDEIKKTHQLVKDILSYEIKGFRAPNFEFDMELINILSKNNYNYDSSILKTPYGPLLNRIKYIISKYLLKNKFKIKCFNKIINKKYSKILYDFNKDKNNKALYEIPISTFPILKFPIHASFAVIMPGFLKYFLTLILFYFHLLFKIPLVYVFHLSELAEKKHLIGIESKLYSNIYGRIKFVTWVCKIINKKFRSITTNDYVEKFRNLGK